jgi:hypothetical protein
MNKLNLYCKLKCAFKNDHIVDTDARKLNCEHFICQKCIPDNKLIQCQHCGQQGTQLSDVKNESNFVNKIILSNLNELFDELEKETVDGIDKYKSILSVLNL